MKNFRNCNESNLFFVNKNQINVIIEKTTLVMTKGLNNSTGMDVEFGKCGQVADQRPDRIQQITIFTTGMLHNRNWQ